MRLDGRGSFTLEGTRYHWEAQRKWGVMYFSFDGWKTQAKGQRSAFVAAYPDVQIPSRPAPQAAA